MATRTQKHNAQMSKATRMTPVMIVDSRVTNDPTLTRHVTVLEMMRNRSLDDTIAFTYIPNYMREHLETMDERRAEAARIIKRAAFAIEQSTIKLANGNFDAQEANEVVKAYTTAIEQVAEWLEVDTGE